MNTVRSLINDAYIAFKQQGISDPEQEARYLVTDLLGITITDSFIWPGKEVDRHRALPIQTAIQRRCTHEPFAYIQGKCDFYGRSFLVNQDVLIPRPETELLVELAIDFIKSCNRPLIIADIGTGSGNIALSLALEFPGVKVWAIDVSEAALDVAKANAVKYNIVNVWFAAGDLLEPLDCQCDLIVANLPYISDADFDSLPPEIGMHEPVLALRGGPDGLRVIERLMGQSARHLKKNGALMLEIGGTGQDHAVRQMANRYYPDGSAQLYRDLNDLNRVIKIKPSK